MPTLGITGGIATGKSSFTKLLAAQLAATVFDADASVKDLLDHNSEVRSQVRATFGEQAFMDDGKVNRTFLRENVFSNSEKKRKLEQILHPLVRQRWMGLAAQSRKPDEWLLLDIPLLYETTAEQHLDKVVVVACDGSTQQARLLTDRKLDAGTAKKIIATQMDLGVKISKADHVVWNGGSHDALARQAGMLANFLATPHG